MAQGIDLRHRPDPGARGGVNTMKAIEQGFQTHDSESFQNNTI